MVAFAQRVYMKAKGLFAGESSLVAAVDGLSRLGPGWDSYEANPVHGGACKLAKDFLIGFEKQGLPHPFIGPTADGGVALVWRKTPASLEVFFSDAGGRYIATRNQQLVGKGTVGEVDAFLPVFKDLFAA